MKTIILENHISPELGTEALLGVSMNNTSICCELDFHCIDTNKSQRHLDHLNQEQGKRE
jgi:hypothetical protein